MKKRMLIMLLAGSLLFTIGCSPAKVCPTYESAARAKLSKRNRLDYWACKPEYGSKRKYKKAQRKSRKWASKQWNWSECYPR